MSGFSSSAPPSGPAARPVGAGLSSALPSDSPVQPTSAATHPLPPKPGRTTTKRITYAVVLNAIVLPYAALYLASDQFGVAVGASVSMIALALGIYQGAGHADLRALLARNSA